MRPVWACAPVCVCKEVSVLLCSCVYGFVCVLFVCIFVCVRECGCLCCSKFAMRCFACVNMLLLLVFKLTYHLMLGFSVDLNANFSGLDGNVITEFNVLNATR